MLLYHSEENWFVLLTDGKVPRQRDGCFPDSRYLMGLCVNQVLRCIPAAKNMKVGDAITIDVVERKPKRKARRTQPQDA